MTYCSRHIDYDTTDTILIGGLSDDEMFEMIDDALGEMDDSANNDVYTIALQVVNRPADHTPDEIAEACWTLIECTKLLHGPDPVTHL